MEGSASFGYWLRRRRKALDLTQEELAQQVGCSVGLIRMIEADERRPSRQMATRLADCLDLGQDERTSFIKAARAELSADRLVSPIPAAPPEAHQATARRRGEIKGYELREQIGSGGFGAVYHAYQPKVGREVAIKIILPQYANHPDFIRRFEAEAHLVARLEHPHIVPLYDYWREPDGAYLVMRYIRGGNLAVALRRGPWSIDASARLLKQLAAALVFAHRHQIVHRDLKPTNILLDEEGNAYLADFGVARDLSNPALADQRRTGAITSSPAYLSPEQIRDEPVTPQTDIYSLGVLLYELLTGAHPFADLAPADILAKHLHEALPPLRLRRPELPDALDAVIRKAAAKHPAERYPDVASLVADFLRTVNAGNRSASPLPPDLTTAVSVAPIVPQVTQRTLAVAHAHVQDSAALAASVLAVENPYKGLRAFTEADAATFFGRTAFTERLLERLAEETALARFLVLVGPSGSGKSSIVRAGLVPALRQGLLPGSAQWFVTDMLPGTHPLEELEAALLRIAVNPPPSLLAQLQEDERGLVRAVKRVLPADAETELVLIVDQFEELFTLTTDESARRHLLDSLRAAVADPRSRVWVILTLRADFYDRPLLYPVFGDLVRQRTEVVLPLAPEELRQAIVCPAQRAGVTLEAELVAAIVKDVGEQPGTLPLLQYALTELFERRVEQRLTLEAYNARGGVPRALAQRAEELYTGLNPQQQAAARQLFLRLVTPGVGVEDTRRRVHRSELLSVVSCQLSVAPENNGPLTTDNGQLAMDRVIDVYSKYRLLTFDRDPITRDPTVEVAHEALIRTWGRLRDWLDASRDDVRLQRRIATAAAEWLNAGRDPSFLATGARLEQFAGWAAETSLALNQAEQAYLDAGIAERERQVSAERESQAQKARLARRARNFLLALVLVLLLATAGALALAGIARRSAAEAQNLALAAGAQAELSRGNTDQALALALAASRMDRPVTLAQFTLAEAAYAPGTRRHFQGHRGPVSAVAFSPDGRAALSASEDQTLILWDALTGTRIRDLTGHQDKVLGVAFSPDGLTALSASLDTTLILWDVASGQPIRRFEGHTDGVLGVAFSPDGTTALSASADRTLILWDVASGQPIRRFEGHTDGVLGVAFSPDGLTALSASLDTTLILWDIKSGRPIRSLQGHADAVNAVAFSPDGQTALSASADRTLILWDIKSGRLIRSLQGHTDAINAVAFSPDGLTALSGSGDTRLGVWDIRTGELIRFLAGHGGGIKAIASSPDGRSVLSGSADASLRLWDLNNGAELQRFTGHTDRVRSVAFSPDERVALSSSEDTTLLLWDVAGGRLIRQFQGHTAGVNGLAFSPDGRTALSGSGDKTLILWDVASGRPLRRFQGHMAGVTGVTFSPDGLTALSASLDKTLILWDVAGGRLLRRFEGHTDNVYRAAFSPDGHTALSTSGDHTLILWDVASGQLLRRFVGHSGAVRDVAFSSDGRTALSGAEDTFLILWDVATGQSLRRFVGHNAKIYGVAFSPDDRTALSASTDTSVMLWNVATGEAIRRFTGHTAEVRDVAFSRDGRTFLTASQDMSVRLWRIDSLDELIAWTIASRYVPELTCDQRKLYRQEPACDDKVTR